MFLTDLSSNGRVKASYIRICNLMSPDPLAAGSNPAGRKLLFGVC